MKKPFLFLLLSGLCFLAGCASYRLAKTLAPEHKEFFSQVRYLISSEERKIFLNLPSSERDKFIEDFWKKRDPDPETEENEFKLEYFDRIEEANRLFSSMAAPGWLQDRGRIYILLGPPDQRDAFPRGKSLYDPPFEIWYYGFYPILFIDGNWTGDYRLEPSSAMEAALINEAQMERKPQGITAKRTFGFTLQVRLNKPNEILVLATVPYKNVWFSTEGNTLKTTFKISVEIMELDEKHQEKKKIREEEKLFPLVFKEEDFLKNIEKSYKMELAIPNIPQGNYSLQVKVLNEADGSQAFKKEVISL